MSITTGRYSVSLTTRLARHLMRLVFRGIFHALSHVTITGLENVPPRGAYLVATNHVSLYEPPFIIAFWPVALEAAGAVDIWSRPGQSLLARWYGGIPIRRGEYDRQLLGTLLSILRSDYPLLLMPEGGRSHTPGMNKARPGIAYLVEKTGVPVIPVGISGTTDDFLRRALHGHRPELRIHIGKPVQQPVLDSPAGNRRLERQHYADQVMAAIADLLPAEYRGVYGS